MDIKYGGSAISTGVPDHPGVAYRRNGCTALHEAAANSNVESLKLLLAASADFDAKDGRDRTPLHEAACKSGNAVSLLLYAGATANVADEMGRTPLHEAAKFRNPGTLKLMLDNGAEVAARDNENRTALYAAACSSKNVEVLLDAGGDVCF